MITAPFTGRSYETAAATVHTGYAPQQIRARGRAPAYGEISHPIRELLFGSWIFVAIGMILERQRAKRIFDLLFVGIPRDAEHFVVITLSSGWNGGNASLSWSFLFSELGIDNPAPWPRASRTRFASRFIDVRLCMRKVWAKTCSGPLGNIAARSNNAR